MDRAEMIKQEQPAPLQREEEKEDQESEMMEMAPPPFQLTADDQQGESPVGPGTVSQKSMAPPEMAFDASKGF